MKRKLLLILLAVLFSATTGYGEQVYTVERLLLDVQTTTKGNLGLPDSLWFEIANAGIQDLSTKADCAIDTISVIVTSGTFEYALPASFQKLWHAIDVSTQRVFDVIAADQRGQGKTGLEIEETKIYTYASALRKGIGFYPTPALGDTVLVYFFETPDIIDANADTVNIAEPFHPALKIACLKQVWERTERYDKANREAVALITEINNVRDRLRRQPDVIIGPRTIPRDY